MGTLITSSFFTDCCFCWFVLSIVFFFLSFFIFLAQEASTWKAWSPLHSSWWVHLILLCPFLPLLSNHLSPSLTPLSLFLSLCPPSVSSCHCKKLSHSWCVSLSISRSLCLSVTTPLSFSFCPYGYVPFYPHFVVILQKANTVVSNRICWLESRLSIP